MITNQCKQHMSKPLILMSWKKLQTFLQEANGKTKNKNLSICIQIKPFDDDLNI